MKSLKRILASFALIAGLGVTALHAEPASEKAGDKKRAAAMMGNGEGKLKMLTQRLDLTEAQVEKIKPIVMEEAKALNEVRKDTSIKGPEKQAKMKEVAASFSTRIRAELTPEQQAQFDKMKTMIQEHRMGPGEKGPGPKKKKKNADADSNE